MATLAEVLASQQPNRAAKSDMYKLPEELALAEMSPVDAMKFRTELANRAIVSPEQAAANRKRTMMDIAYATPIVGNVLSAMDVPGYFSDAASNPDLNEARKSMAMGELSVLGAIPGLPFGGMKRAVRGAENSTRIFAGGFPGTRVYHGTADQPERFMHGKDLFLSESPELASHYSRTGADIASDYTPVNAAVYPAQVDPRSMKSVDLSDYIWDHDGGKRLDAEIAKAKAEGYHGLIAKGMTDADGYNAFDKGDQYVAWHPSIVESAFGGPLFPDDQQIVRYR